MNYEICVIGNEALLFPFLQFGFTTYTPESDEDLREYLQKIIAQNYGIIYIEDSYCFKVQDILEKYRCAPTPIFVPIGENSEGESYYAQTVKEMTENAIGMNVL
jgi:vacuolar-type H+-ATPase subunit F/Vma7